LERGKKKRGAWSVERGAWSVERAGHGDLGVRWQDTALLAARHVSPGRKRRRVATVQRARRGCGVKRIKKFLVVERVDYKKLENPTGMAMISL
jgi:hypothetical protein